MYKINPAIILFIITGTMLAACNQTNNPEVVADRYWQHLQSGNIVEAEKLVSENSRAAFAEMKNRITPNTQIMDGEAITTVSTTITTVYPDNNYTHQQTFDTVLVLQQDEWKIDANRTQIPPALGAKEEEMQRLADQLSESMQKNIDSIDTAVSEGMEMLNEAMQEGSQEMGDSLLNMLNELNSKMQESIDKIKQRRQQQLEEKQQQQMQPDPADGEGMI